MTRYGLGWRAPLGAAILANLDRIDVVEVMAEDFFDATAKERRALRTLRRFVPVVLHATSLGLASPEPVDRRRLDGVARVAGWLEPDYWSEHLAFVRGGGVEVGHLAAPPRNDATLDGLLRNFELATRVVGSEPLLENVASLVEPPLCTYSEGEWLQLVPGRLLLDLHNLHANATNFGFCAGDVVRSLARIGAVHLAGGKRIEGGRVLDDHKHCVPDAVYELLALVPECDVILERDGLYPPIAELLAELDRARAVERMPRFEPMPASTTSARPAAAQHFLARLYVHDLDRFLAAPYETARAAGFDDDDARSIAAMNQEDLVIATASFAKKRALTSP